MERALVLQSLGIPFQVQQMGAGCHLIVPAERAEAALAELSNYETENVGWPPHYDAPPLLSKGKLGAGLYAALIVAMFPVGRQGLLGHNFWDAGKMQAGAVLDGEWWRTVTALTLHGGLSHLIGNAVFGVGFALLAAHSLGGGLTWLGFVLAGGLGNLVNAWLQGAAHTSIGASTGVFGVLGMLAAYEWFRRHTLYYPPMRRFAPIIGGIALFGFLGVGGADSNTDVIAHVTGLGCGGALGALAAAYRAPARLGTSGQRVAAALGAALLVIAWALALTSVPS
ncbi:MAG: rhomboid protease GluP [Chlamydiales bacterium]|jgi:rhomboid protease GluP